MSLLSRPSRLAAYSIKLVQTAQPHRSSLPHAFARKFQTTQFNMAGDKVHKLTEVKYLKSAIHNSGLTAEAEAKLEGEDKFGVSHNPVQNPNKKHVVVVDAFAVWCGPCKAIEPIVDELSKQYDAEVHFVQVDVDDSPDVAQELNIRAMPTFTIFKDGKKYDELVGARPPQLKALVAKAVAEIGA